MTTHQIGLLLLWLIPSLYWVIRMFKEGGFNPHIIWFLIPVMNLFAMVVVLTCEDRDS